ncbi:TonB-dependent receptor domain-containing protein [Parvularcula lutaonensis]|uniref:TonB-dependent receptor domain-containing protein n=1 Tax=Parvularcula lutaonensis TaxID=491923 RepID=A0ABV7MCY2_9PROT|nr:TonB-dependent receptor [Parvularcula lutaonensis]GGY38324.1 TonB-dependent receptor [Parvularcula lutaonensis]
MSSDDGGDVITVRGVFIPNEQESSSQVATFLDDEDLARTGDATAAEALTRLSGLSVVGGRFAYIRGLGDRYSSALLNGSPLPSPDPLRRTVPLDLFPSNILSGAAVQKTFSADYPGEFGGGIIDLRTTRLPSEPFLTLKAGSAYNSETTGKDGLFVRGGDSDWTGFSFGLRDVPDPLQAVLDSDQRLNELSDRQIEIVGESLINSPLTVIQSGELGPNWNGSIEGGTSFLKGDLEIGLVGVVGYNQQWTTERAKRQTVRGDVLAFDFDATETILDVTANALTSASANWGQQEIQSTLFYVHSTSKEAQISEGLDFDAQGENSFTESSGWYERELIMFQTSGDHVLGDFELNWRGALAESSRDAPYERFVQREVDDTGTPRYSVANRNGTNFSFLEDQVASGGADLSYSAMMFDGLNQIFTVGYDFSTTERTYDFFSFRFAGGNSLPDDVQLARTDFLFSPDNIDPARFELIEVSSVNDSYEAELTVNAAFAQADLELTPFIRSTLGVRYEDAEQFVFTRDRFGNVGTRSDLNNDYVLPAATITWNFADDMQLRFGYSETITRPQFRELARSSYFDPQNDRVYRGNDGLIDSQLTNYDARVEWYLGREQFVTLAGFYKEIENPIEEIQIENGTFVFETTFINSPKAELFGLEAEYRNTFMMPFGGAWFEDRDWLFSANYTYTNSEVQAEEGDLIVDPLSGRLVEASLFGLDGADLQGAPEHIANTQFGWESDREQMTLLVGYVSNRILQRGIPLAGAELPDIVEEPGVQLDLVYRRDFEVKGRDFTLGISGRNLLNTEHREFQNSGGSLGETEFNTYDRGMSLSASLSASF